MRRLATANGVTPAYLLAPEVSALLFYMPDLQSLHAVLDVLEHRREDRRIPDADPGIFDLDGCAVVKVLSAKSTGPPWSSAERRSAPGTPHR